MNENNLKSVYSSGNFLFAISVQDELEKAGIPTFLMNSSNGTYLDVKVPAEMVDEALRMLFVEPRTGEIFSSVSRY